MKKVLVNLGNNSYQVLIGAGLLAQAGRYLREIGLTGKAVIVTDPTVRHLYGSTLERSLTEAGFKVTTLPVPEGEEQKSLETAGRLYQELSHAYAERQTPILALGGGVIGDLTGFVAATYLRGVPLVQVPTTLLAQVDSSIGGKVAVNFGQLKNKIGAFYQPRLVISDIDILKSLTPAEFSDGLAEIIKYAVIRDGGFFELLENGLERIKARDEGLLEEIIFRSSQIKAEVVAGDERDLGIRNILNLGHTIGHGIESASDFAVSHGQAVALGMIGAGSIANQLKILESSELVRLKSLIARAGLPVRLPGLSIPGIIQAMKHDKKISQGKIRFVLPRTIGNVYITDEVSLS
ncbi:MAG: 3-dehydroquinate synthase, partial [Dehalococcoidales bacterium]|nr:3-dehydroquinate synthase [Dehalococcoidales bacterium]